MGARVRVLDAGDQDLRGRERLDEVGDERDGSADAGLHGRAAPTGGHGGGGLGHGPARRVNEEGVALVDVAELHVRAEGTVPLDVRLEGAVRVRRRLAGGDARADADGHLGEERVAGVGDGGRVDARDRDGRLRPEAREDGAGAHRGDTRQQRRLLGEARVVVGRRLHVGRGEARDGDGSALVPQ